MKLFNLSLLLISALLILGGVYVHLVGGGGSIWSELLLGAGLLGTFGAFSTFLLTQTGGVEVQ